MKTKRQRSRFLPIQTRTILILGLFMFLCKSESGFLEIENEQGGNSVDFENDTIGFNEVEIADGHNVYVNHVYLKHWRTKCGQLDTQIVEKSKPML